NKQDNKKAENGETERWKSAAATKFIGNTHKERRSQKLEIDRLGSAYCSCSRSRSGSGELSLQSPIPKPQSPTCRVFHYELLLTMFHFS
ncbi:hypothetical protein M5D96_005035, partial [Drosophila gunungcola]